MTGTIFITGATAGIGREAARLFARDGWSRDRINTIELMPVSQSFAGFQIGRNT